ncbi:hypothetical protein LNP74_07970 [Klebsiella pneumoniae subsp. pneumoniae]|nr:hypothetical protein [Klebsiella pneumoniae subsp. pneumoniae]
MSYKAGDSWKASAKGKSNQPVVFIDTTGRSYAIDPITLPSARGQGGTAYRQTRPCRRARPWSIC